MGGPRETARAGGAPQEAGAVLLDVGGCLVTSLGGGAIPGAPEAVAALRERRPVRFVTNTTSRTRPALAGLLRAAGFAVEDEDEIVTPALLARTVLGARGHDRGVLLADAGARGDLGWFSETAAGDARAVLVATEAHDRTIADLGDAVTALRSGASLYTLQENRVYQQDGRLLTDLGPVAAFLAYAADATWENLGKPSPLLFRTVADSLGCAPGDLVMVGDDAEFDVAGALRAGVGRAVLVRTGKYRAGDEERYEPRPTAVLRSVAELAAAL